MGLSVLYMFILQKSKNKKMNWYSQTWLVDAAYTDFIQLADINQNSCHVWSPSHRLTFISY